LTKKLPPQKLMPEQRTKKRAWPPIQRPKMLNWRPSKQRLDWE
jgi:hypothetical protein